MNNSLYLKKIDETIDYSIRKRSNTFNLEYLVNYVINKININTTNENDTNELENILIKLMNSGFGTTVKTYCYYIISNFNHEFSSSFFSSIASKVTADATSFDKFDANLNSLRNYSILNEKTIIDNITILEQLFKNPKCNLNYIVNSFYFSNFPIVLLNALNKISYDEYRTYKEFLKKFYLELGKLLFFPKIEDGTFLNLLKILTKILSKFLCFNELSTKEKLINSIVVYLAEYLVSNIDEIVDLIKSFDHKLLVQVIEFPVYLYKIYNYFRDQNNPNMKFERAFHKYMTYLFKELRNLVDPDLYSEFSKTICEFKIIESDINPHLYSTEIIELTSKFIELSDHFDKSTWFDSNMKVLSKLLDFVDYTEVIDLTLNLLSDTKNIHNLSDRINTIYNLFSRLIMLNIDYSNWFEKESLILCLFKQDWFVFLVNDSNLDERKSRWKHDLFICLIESLFRAKTYILNKGYLKKYLIIIKICQDIIDVCYKILDWSDEGEAYKMYFLVLEETCLFFDDPFFFFVFGQDPEFMKMKGRLEDILIEISKRFLSKNWATLNFANENSKYRSLLLLSQFLNIDKIDYINNLVDMINIRLKEIPFDSKNERYIEDILRACLFLGIRVHYKTREKIITFIAEFVEKINSKTEAEPRIVNNIRTFSENILNYLIEHKSDPQIILDSKIVDKLTSEFYLIIPKDIENNISQKTVNYNNLYLINLCENSLDVIESSKENTSIYLDYYKKYNYVPMLEYNNDSCHMLIDSKERYIFSEWKLITGTSDPVHIYYMFKIDIETREIELFIKNFNSTSCVLNNVLFNVYFSQNLMLFNEENLSMNYSPYVNSKEFNVELLSPFSQCEFSVKFYSKIFEKNNIGIDCTFDMVTDQCSRFTLNSESFYIPLTDFLLKDNFSLYETKKFDIFYNTLEYAFTCKCFTNCTPDDLISNLSSRVVLVEYKSKSRAYDKKKEILEKIKEKQYPEYFRLNAQKENEEENGDGFNINEENQRFNFKVKLCSYSIYNFWVYIVIIGDYNFQNNKSILTIEVKTNELFALNIISREKNCFFNELMNKKIKFY